MPLLFVRSKLRLSMVIRNTLLDMFTGKTEISTNKIRREVLDELGHVVCSSPRLCIRLKQD